MLSRCGSARLTDEADALTRALGLEAVERAQLPGGGAPMDTDAIENPIALGGRHLGCQGMDHCCGARLNLRRSGLTSFLESRT